MWMNYTDTNCFLRFFIIPFRDQQDISGGWLFYGLRNIPMLWGFPSSWSAPTWDQSLMVGIGRYRHRGHRRGLEMRKGAIWAQGNILPGQEVHGQAWSWACQNPWNSCSGAPQTWLWLKKTILLIDLPKGLKGGGLWRPSIPRQRDWWRQRLWADVLGSLLAPHLSPLVIALLLLPRQFGATLAGEFLSCRSPFLGVDGMFWCCLSGGHMDSQAACAFRSCPVFSR